MALIRRTHSPVPTRSHEMEWDPFASMRDLMNWDPLRTIAPRFMRTVGELPGVFIPGIDVRETKDAYVVTADLPGFKEQDVSVQVSGNRVTLSGERKMEKVEDTDTWYLCERSQGNFSRTFTLPDDLTTFRIMAVVQDQKAAFGKAEREVRVNRPLIARPALPRFFRDGDKVLAGVVVHNNTPADVNVAVTATAEGATLKGAPRTVALGPNGAQEVPFAISDFTGTSVKFRFEAQGGGNRDAVEVKVPVSATLPQEVVATSGSTETEAHESIAVPKGAVPSV